MTIYYTVKTAFIPYLDTFKEELELPSLEVNQNWTTQKQVLPILLQATPFDNRLLKPPGTLKGLVQQYKQKSQMVNKAQENKPKNEFFDSIAIDIFLFVAAIVSMLALIAIIHIVCRHAKLKALLTGIAFQPVKQAEAVVAQQMKEFCTAQWYAIEALTVLTILLIVYICLSNQRCTLFKYSNYYVVLFRHQAVCSSKIVQISRQYSFISALWTIGFRPNNPRKTLSMGHDKNRLERSFHDFEWHNNKDAKNG